MGTVPVVHEVGTAFQSLGHLIVADTKKAKADWNNYAHESVIGSGVKALVHVAKGNPDKAEEYGKGCGRAFGQAVLGGGILKEVPVFKELSKCGKSLGDVIGGGDTEMARKRWTEEYVREYSDPDEWLKAGISVGTTVSGVGLCLLTAGAALPVVIGASAGIGAGASVVDNVGKQTVDCLADPDKEFDIGEVLGAGLTGGALGAATAGIVEGIKAAKGSSSTASATETAPTSATEVLVNTADEVGSVAPTSATEVVVNAADEVGSVATQRVKVRISRANTDPTSFESSARSSRLSTVTETSSVGDIPVQPEIPTHPDIQVNSANSIRARSGMQLRRAMSDTTFDRAPSYKQIPKFRGKYALRKIAEAPKPFGQEFCEELMNPENYVDQSGDPDLYEERDEK